MNSARRTATAGTSLPGRDASPGAAQPALPETTLHRWVIVSLAVVSLAAVWLYLGALSRTDPWYRNTDMNIHNMVDALALNSGQPPRQIDQPGTLTKFLLALDYRVLHFTGHLPVWNMKKLGDSPDPLPGIRDLIHIGRIQARVTVILFLLCAAWFAYQITRSLDATCLSVVVLCGSAGLLFHGLLNRTELLCVLFGNVLALLCTWKALASPLRARRHLWLLAAGLCGGLSVLEKLPGLLFLAACYAWCWLAAWLAEKRKPGSVASPDPGDFRRGLLPMAAGGSVLWLLYTIPQLGEGLDAVAIGRLRLAAVFVAILPLPHLLVARRRFWSFLLERGTELAFLGAGALVALPLCYLLFRTILAPAPASNYLAQNIQILFNPGPLMTVLLGAKPEIGREFALFLKDSPLLFVGASAVALAVGLARSTSRESKVIVTLLLVMALGITLLMSRRYFVAQYSIFPQVPLLLAISFGLSALFAAWRKQTPKPAELHWAFPLILSAAFFFMLTVFFRLQPRYSRYQDDAMLPVRESTLTFLFDHDVHPAGYLKLMQDHYGDREKFAKALQEYLADPANRY